MKYFRLSYDTRQLSKKNVELINKTIITELGNVGFSVPEQTHITLDFPIPNTLAFEQHIFLKYLKINVMKRRSFYLGKWLENTLNSLA